ncbi:hypothetical protein BH23BAC1_BH23BAC1_38530 [soil metagenome]
MTSPVRIAALIFAFLFLLFAAFQYNDPDPFIWIPIYGTAALVSVAFYLKKVGLPLLVILLALYFIGAIYMWPSTYEGIILDMGYKIEIEEARESLGLAFCGLAMSLYSFSLYRSKRKAFL